ncbi:MAG: type I 3-dehydroquinate dehydratase [Planctomycetota bacterium]|jgi:3-dehydroquinate dehydratase/shikimate dehydrogenase
MGTEVTFLAVSIAVRAPDEVTRGLARAERAVAGGAKLIEWRIDGLAGHAAAAEGSARLLAGSPAPAIITCRDESEGGEYGGGDEKLGGLLEALLLGDHPPRYVDVELATWQRSPGLRQRIVAALAQTGRRDVHSSLVLSAHDFDGRPADLIQRVESMTAEPACAVIKVAWRARSLRDNLEALDLLAERRKPTIALCMGPFGLMSRVLAPKLGGLLVYASDESGAETAPGQPTVDELRQLYRFDRLGAQTRVYGVIGWPVEHSLSPAVHNAGFAAIDHDGVYLPLPVPPEYEHFKATVGMLVDHARLDFRGASVTVPHKENLLRFIEERGGEVDEDARRIGAANTLSVSDDGGLMCSNTDAPGMLAALCAAMAIEPPALAGMPVAVLGAGGVGRAVAAALSRAGAKVTVFDLVRSRVEALTASLHGQPTVAGGPAHVAAGTPEALTGGGFPIYVNCTPVGMAGGPAPDQSPLPDATPLDADATVFDCVYTPTRTPLLARAEAAGARVVTGKDMFLRQAAMQFEQWTGQPAPTGRTGGGPRPS